MCKKRNSAILKLKRPNFANPHAFKQIRIDPCMKGLVRALNEHDIETLACCCGHGRYPMTIVYRDKREGRYGKSYIAEFCSGWSAIRRYKRFYKKDRKGFYYIPEVSKERK